MASTAAEADPPPTRLCNTLQCIVLVGWCGQDRPPLFGGSLSPEHHQQYHRLRRWRRLVNARFLILSSGYGRLNGRHACHLVRKIATYKQSTGHVAPEITRVWCRRVSHVPSRWWTPWRFTLGWFEGATLLMLQWAPELTNSTINRMEDLLSPGGDGQVLYVHKPQFTLIFGGWDGPGIIQREGNQVKTKTIISRKESKRSGYAHGGEESRGMPPCERITFTVNVYLNFRRCTVRGTWASIITSFHCRHELDTFPTVSSLWWNGFDRRHIVNRCQCYIPLLSTVFDIAREE